MDKNNQYPLILVIYLDRELMTNKAMVQGFSNYVGEMIEEKDANIMAFFLPTDNEERIECINPVQVEPADMERINGLLEELTKEFQLGKLDDEADEKSLT